MITFTEELAVARLTLDLARRSKDSSVFTVTFGIFIPCSVISNLQESLICLMHASFLEFSGWQHELLL